MSWLVDPWCLGKTCMWVYKFHPCLGDIAKQKVQLNDLDDDTFSYLNFEIKKIWSRITFKNQYEHFGVKSEHYGEEHGPPHWKHRAASVVWSHPAISQFVLYVSCKQNWFISWKNLRWKVKKSVISILTYVMRRSSNSLLSSLKIVFPDWSSSETYITWIIHSFSFKNILKP